MRKVSPLGAPAMPVAPLRPLPPAISGLKKIDAPFHNRRPKKIVVVSESFALRG